MATDLGSSNNKVKAKERWTIITMKLKDMTDRQLILFNIGETRRNTKLLNNHLKHVWQIIIALVGVTGVAITSLLIALVT